MSFTKISRGQYDDFKKSVEKMVYRYASRDRTTIISLITSSIDCGYDKKKLEDKLLDLTDRTLAYKLADKVRNIFR